MLDIIIKNIQCGRCRGNLQFTGNACQCVECGKFYQVKGKTIIFTDTTSRDQDISQMPDGLIFKLKFLVKKSPKLFYILNHVLGTFVGKSAKKSIAYLSPGSLIVNIGSGAQTIRTDVVNLDLTPYPGVAVVADVQQMPFKNNSVDALIAESLLEHVKYPELVVSEIQRVLKPGGLIYITTPFIIGWHSSPNDYYRWTTSGLRELLRGFKEQEFGILVGPTNACTYILREWLAILLSFNLRTLYQLWLLFFMVVFAPINLLDHILSRFGPAKNIAHVFYYIGYK